MTRIPARIAFLIAAGTVANVAHAGQADVCMSPSGPIQSLPALSNATVFTCPQAGSHTIPELAQAGWKIVQVGPVSDGGLNGYHELIIQK